MRLEVFVPSWRKDGRKGKRLGKPLGLHGRNECEVWARSSKYGANSNKQNAEKKVAEHVRAAMEEQGWVQPEGLTVLTLTLVDPKPKRDEDNILGSMKYLIDALCEPTVKIDRNGRERWTHRNGCGAIKDDDPAHLHIIVKEVEYDEEHPGARLVLESEER